MSRPHGETIDTRNLIDRIEELETENQDLDYHVKSLSEWLQEDREEYQLLVDLIGEVRAGSDEDPVHGVTLIREDYFTQHIKEECAELGGEYYQYDDRRCGNFGYHLIPFDKLIERMPFKHIDWEAVADEERADYNEVEYDGYTYLHRAA